MHFEYNCRSSVTIVFFLPVTLIPCVIFKAEYRLLYSTGEPDNSSKPWHVVMVGLSAISELNTFHVGNGHMSSLCMT